LVLGLSASRSSFQILDRLYTKQFAPIEKENILLYGAEDAGEIALRWILRNPSTGYCVVGFIDEDPMKKGSNIHGVNILGDSDLIDQYIREKQIVGIITTIPDLKHSPQGEKIITSCKLHGIWIRTLRIEFELFE
jgi:FlaA1/EpsC-like NDP-sugar epimerase